ncbi:MAG TPA: AI-2E family transporter [Vicinamibacterales bacterium]|nr:AI-2E family transporter [Vicinamibacterales bacterium]
MLTDRDFRRRMLETVLAVTGVAIAIAVLWAAREALMLVYVSALIAMGFAPIVVVIEQRHATGRRKVPRWLAILIIYLAILGVIVLIGLMVIPPLVAQAESLWTKLPGEFNRFQNFLIQHKLMTHRVTLEEAVQNAPSGASGNAVGTVLVAISSLIGGIFRLITILILTFYLLIEANAMFEYCVRFVPASRRADVALAAREAVTKVSAWLRAQFVLAGVMGVFAAVGLGLMGVPYFYVIALIAAIGETIPIVGPVIGGVTAVAVAITVSPKLALTVGLYFLALHQLEANVLVPKIMERRVGVSPVAVMIALLVGGALWGMVGAILAIPTAAILSVIVEELAASRETRLHRVR